MEKNKKLIAMILGAMLFFGVVFFIGILVMYTPPEKTEQEAMNIPQKDSVNTPPLSDPDVPAIENEPAKNAPVSNEAVVAEKDSSIRESLEKDEILLSGILVTVLDQAGNKISGNKCALEVADEKTGQWTILYSRLSDQNGNCNFYDLDSKRDFLLVIYWTGDKTGMSQMRLGGSLIPGETSSWSVSQAEGFRAVRGQNL